MGEERMSFVMAVPLCLRFHKYHILGRLPRAPFPPLLCVLKLCRMNPSQTPSHGPRPRTSACVRHTSAIIEREPDLLSDLLE
jgi:hypothetical protein